MCTELMTCCHKEIAMASRLIDRMQGYCRPEPLADVPTSCVDFLPTISARPGAAGVRLPEIPERPSHGPRCPVRFICCDLSRFARADRHPAWPLAATAAAGAGTACVVRRDRDGRLHQGRGLGDVAAALPRAVRGACDSRVLLPGYPEVLQRLPQLQRVGQVSARAGLPACGIGMAVQADGLPIYVLLSPELYEREGSPYVDGQGRSGGRTTRFASPRSHAAAEIAAGRAGLDWSPQLLHLNDWPVAMAAAYVRWDRTTVPTLLTIHNLAYQGCFRMRLHLCWACRSNTWMNCTSTGRCRSCRVASPMPRG